jgi:hypothetical protein
MPMASRLRSGIAEAPSLSLGGKSRNDKLAPPPDRAFGTVFQRDVVDSAEEKGMTSLVHSL